MVAEGTTAKERRPSSRALLTVEEVAGYFGVTMTTVYRWCREGRIPCLKIGKHWRVRREELMALLKESERAERSR
jgi:excisionase family DNA binding protein